jgi:hypothetical protein
MSDADQAAQHIDQLEKRLASLHDLGVDTAALRSQLAFARTRLSEGRTAEVEAICEEVTATARRLADGSVDGERPRTGRFTRDQLAQAVQDLLSQGLLTKLMAEQRSGPDIRLETRLRDLDERLRNYLSSEADALRAEQQVVREEMEQLRRSVGSAAPTPSADHGASAPASDSAKEPLWAARLHSILVKAIRRADAQASQIATIIQQLSGSLAHGSTGDGLGQAVEQLRSGLTDDLRSLVAERLPGSAPAPSDGEPSWAAALSTTLNTLTERLQSAPVVAGETSTTEPAWSQGLRQALQAVAERLAIPAAMPVATPVITEPAEPAWSTSLREAFAAAAARHQEVLAALARPTPPSDEVGLGDRLGAAVERGLQGLGALLAPQGRRATAMDDSNSALSPVTARVVEHGSTRTDRMAIAPPPADDLRRLVEREVEARLGNLHTTAITAQAMNPDQVRALLAAELDRRRGGAIERSDVGDQRATLLRLLPELLADEGVRQSLFTVLALEAVSKPGALGELTGLRAFLKRELSHAAEELAGRLQPA